MYIFIFGIGNKFIRKKLSRGTGQQKKQAPRSVYNIEDSVKSKSIQKQCVCDIE